MKPQDLFRVIVRSIALWLCVWGSWNTLAGIKYLVPTLSAMISGRSYQHDSFGYLIYGVPALFGGLVVLMFADSLVRFTYPRPKPPPLPRPAEAPGRRDSATDEITQPNESTDV
jgi:hypothetical protein